MGLVALLPSLGYCQLEKNTALAVCSQTGITGSVESTGKCSFDIPRGQGALKLKEEQAQLELVCVSLLEASPELSAVSSLGFMWE